MADDTQSPEEAFIEAVETDTYGELSLKQERCAGCTLITDWAGDGTFHPYIVPHNGHMLDPTAESVQSALTDEIGERLDVRVKAIEWSESNGAWYPVMDRPDK